MFTSVFRARASALRLCLTKMSLFQPVLKCDIQKVAELLGQKHDPNSKDRQGRTVMHIASRKGFSTIMLLLLENGADVNVEDQFGNTPLHMCGHMDTLKVLYEHGANINTLNLAGLTPFDLARRRGVPQEVVDELKHWSCEVLDHQGLLAPSGCVGLWQEFTTSVGPVNLLVLLTCLVLVSFYVACLVTGYTWYETDTRTLVETADQRHIEL